jgi:DNA-binding NarL/FixJ family response regulator
MPNRVLIVDDHEIVRMGVRRLLGSNPRWVICGEAVDGRQAIEQVRRLAPDAVILDLSMPVMNGVEVASEIRRIAPSAKIVYFSTHQAPASGMLPGGDAFVTKSSAARDLNATLERLLGKDAEHLLGKDAERIRQESRPTEPPQRSPKQTPIPQNKNPKN